MGGVLYISYTGMLEPLGQGQVLAYLERLSGRYAFHLLSFEKPGWRASPQRALVERRMAAAGIAWHPLDYHGWPSLLATGYDIARGIRLGAQLVRRHGLRIVHARSYVPAMMALAIKRRRGVRFLFDMRGFWADERVDSGRLRRGSRFYRYVKGRERQFLLCADAVVSLTQAAADEIASFDYLRGRTPPVAVIPTCADLDLFRPDRHSGDAFVLGYVGSTGNWYDFGAVLDCFASLREIVPDARLSVVTQDDHAKVRASVAGRGWAAGSVEVRSASHSEVPELIRGMSAGILVAKPSYAHLARAPTRFAEFLGCGVPFACNEGIGDITAIIAGEGVGVVIRALDADGRLAAMRALVEAARDPAPADRCRETPLRRFSVDLGAERYDAVYRVLEATP